MEQGPKHNKPEAADTGVPAGPDPRLNGVTRGAGGPPKKHKKGFAALLVACCLASGALGGAAGALIAGPLPQTAQDAADAATAGAGSQPEGSAQAVAASDGRALTVAQIHDKVGPSVVSISTKQARAVFEGGGGGTDKATGAGSGIIVSADGYIVTNGHVVSGADTVTVYTQDGKEYGAKVVGSDSQTDIALLKIDASGLTPAALGDSDKLVVGETAVAIGNPLGELANTVTVGIVSALDREIDVGGQTMNLLQTDAAINPGNSGGALINVYGEVVGINTAKTAAVGVEGLGFAIPVNDAKPVIEALKADGYVAGRTKLGIYTRDIDENTASVYGLPEGVYVVSVEPFSGAEVAGIRAGDVIVSFDGQSVKTTAEINRIKRRHEVGDTVPFVLVREGSQVSGSVKLGEDR
jgi:serine protease Do